MSDVLTNPVDDTTEEGVIRSSPATHDHTLSDRVAALTETPLEAQIDARMGLRGAVGHRPAPEDFADVISPEGDSGDVFGLDVVESPFLSTEDTLRDPDRNSSP